jgi:hypothetical protein
MRISLSMTIPALMSALPLPNHPIENREDARDERI